MDELLSLPWWLNGRRGAAMTAGQGSMTEVYSGGEVEKTALIERGEYVKNVEANTLSATY